MRRQTKNTVFHGRGYTPAGYDTAKSRPHRRRMKNRQQRGFHAVAPIERLGRVGDAIEGEGGLVLRHFRLRGMEDDDLVNSLGTKFVCMRGKLPQMQIADRAAGKATELQMDEAAVAVGNPHSVAAN